MMYIDNEVLEKMIMTMVEGFNRLEKKLDGDNKNPASAQAPERLPGRRHLAG